MSICLWFALPAALHDQVDDPYEKPQKLKMDSKGGCDASGSCVEASTSSQEKPRHVFQGKVRFDWSAASTASINDLTESWWKQRESEFQLQCRQYEQLHLAE